MGGPGSGRRSKGLRKQLKSIRIQKKQYSKAANVLERRGYKALMKNKQFQRAWKSTAKMKNAGAKMGMRHYRANRGLPF